VWQTDRRAIAYSVLSIYSICCHALKMYLKTNIFLLPQTFVLNIWSLAGLWTVSSHWLNLTDNNTVPHNLFTANSATYSLWDQRIFLTSEKIIFIYTQQLATNHVESTQTDKDWDSCSLYVLTVQHGAVKWAGDNDAMVPDSMGVFRVGIWVQGLSWRGNTLRRSLPKWVTVWFISD